MRPKFWKHHQITQNILAAECPICLRTGTNRFAYISSLPPSTPSPHQAAPLRPSFSRHGELTPEDGVAYSWIHCYRVTEEELTQLAYAKSHTLSKVVIDGEPQKHR